jgi:hypothetical protein
MPEPLTNPCGSRPTRTGHARMHDYGWRAPSPIGVPASYPSAMRGHGIAFAKIIRQRDIINGLRLSRYPKKSLSAKDLPANVSAKIASRDAKASTDPTFSPLVPVDLRRRIFAMVRPANWDFEGGKAIRERDCEAAAEFLSTAMFKGARAPDSVAPSPMGRVALSWRAGPNLVYVEVLAQDKGHLYFQWGGPTDGLKEGMISTGDFISRLLRIARRG